MYVKLAYRLFVVILVIVACSCTNVGSVAHAETLSATDQSVTSTNPAVDSTVNATVDALAAQAAAAGIGVRTVNGVKVFHTRDGRDLKMVKTCGGSEAVIDQGGEVIGLETALDLELNLPIRTEAVRNLPGGSDQRTMSALAFPKLGNVKCYSQQDILWDTVLVGTKTLSSSKLVGDTMYNVGCIVTSAAMEAGTYNIYLPDFNYSTGLLTGTSSQASPKNLNYWLYNHNGFTGSNIIFEAMAGLSSIYGLWQSKLHLDVTVAGIYSTARDMIAGTFNTYIKPSLPIAHLGKTLNGEWIDHYCAWYGSDGSLSNPRNNLIVQPTLTTFSNDTLKCSFDPNDPAGGNKNYSPVNDHYLMRVACWRK